MESYYVVLDSCDKALSPKFYTYRKADSFRKALGRPDWAIKHIIYRISTERQRSAVRFVEGVLGILFKGNINNFTECQEFLNKTLDFAKYVYFGYEIERKSWEWSQD